MIQAATKYGSVRPAGAKAPVGRAPNSRERDSSSQSHKLASGGETPPPASISSKAFNIVTARAASMKPVDFMAWWSKELRTGGELANYCEREKHETPKRYRAVARKMDGFKQNNKSDIRRVADIPARDYFRWIKEDPDFFHDDKNLKSLRRDNPDVKVYL